jgi:hypothetical protein
MFNKTNKLEKSLIYYYGLLQSAHIIAMVVSGIGWLREGDLGILALPPKGGWSPQGVHFLVGTGLGDFFIAICALFFVVQYNRKQRSAVVLGSVALTGSLYSAVVYAYGTVQSGAWLENPLTYTVMSVLFAPMVILAFLYIGRYAVNRPEN